MKLRNLGPIKLSFQPISLFKDDGYYTVYVDRVADQWT